MSYIPIISMVRIIKVQKYNYSIYSDASSLNDDDVHELLDEQNSKQSEKLLNQIDDENMNYDQNVHTD